MDDFRVDVSISDPTATVRVAGELDAATAPLLDEQIRKVEAGAPTREIDLDLTDVTFIDSSGLSALVAAHKRCRARDTSLVVSNANASTRRLFTIAGLDAVLTIR